MRTKITQERSRRALLATSTVLSDPEVDSGKDQVTWLHLHPCLVSSSCRASTNIKDAESRVVLRDLLELRPPQPSPEVTHVSGSSLFIYLFYDNLATGGSLTGVILSCHVKLSKYSTSKLTRNINNTQNEYTALLESITTFTKFVNSVKNSYRNGSRRIRHTV